MKRLHLIAFDNPFPPNYGGVIVVFYHLQALAAAGVEVLLHVFVYGNRRDYSGLEPFCVEIYYYQRSKKVGYLLHKDPFIVVSRANEKLLERLQADTYPIFFEGHHTCAFLGHPSLQYRLKVVRFHNIEWQYYANLGHLESNFFKKIYFQQESQKLKKFDTFILQNADKIITLSEIDAAYYQNLHQAVYYIPPFHGESEVSARVGRGTYVLFHGKLSVKDNEKAALYLVRDIAPQLNCKVIVAGLHPTSALQKAVAQQTNVCLRANLSSAELDALVAGAQVHFLWTFQQAGMKLKLLKALFRGRFCVANHRMVHRTGLEKLCILCETTEQIITTINRVMQKETFDAKILEARRAVLENTFSDQKNIQKTIDLIWK